MWDVNKMVNQNIIIAGKKFAELDLNTLDYHYGALITMKNIVVSEKELKILLDIIKRKRNKLDKARSGIK